MIEKQKTATDTSRKATLPRAEGFIQSKDDELLANLETLLSALDDYATRGKAISLLHELASLLEHSTTHQLNIRKVSVPGLDEPIKLLLTPAIFSPEMWGQTFAEGLLKNPERFNGARVVEVGTGSGWISFLLLLKTTVREIVALDINPVAVTVARLNAWLNGTKVDGTPRLSAAGLPIVGALRVLQSDLLSTVIDTQESFNHLIGCIPQVLHPGGPLEENRSERLSDRELYDLSNYCFEQGILEDRFGLPLIARALEQAQLCLSHGGEVTLILGGRPGPQAIESMFQRRGYDSEILWSRRNEQADDTDLASLVELEKAHGIQFHFFIDRNSRQSISADTAVRLLRKKLPVYHDLLVYRARTRFEQATKSFATNLHRLGLDSLRNEFDLSRMSEEKMSFLVRLSGELLDSKTVRYPHERGDLSLRRRLSDFLKIYCFTNVSANQLFVGPERSVLLSMIFETIAKDGSTVLLSESLRPSYGELVANSRLEPVWGNDDLAELLALDRILRPSILIISPRQLTRPSPLTLNALFAQASENTERFYIIDDSENFEIGSSLDANATLRLTSQMVVPKNVIFLYGLVKSIVCPDLELSFLVNAPADWIENFDIAAEVSYSRIPYPSQLYYEWLFDDLLSFPFPSKQEDPQEHIHQSGAAVRQEFQLAADDPTFAPKPVSTQDPDLIRLDYGELDASVPNILIGGLIKGFIDEPNTSLPSLLRLRVARYLEATRNSLVTPDRIVLAQGVFPLFGALLTALRMRLGRSPRVAVPNGTYGVVYPMISYYGGSVLHVPTSSSSGFLLNPEDLEKLDEKPDLLWLTQPNNPSGLFYDPNCIAKILEYCKARKIYILSDEIFFLLSDDGLGAWTPHELSLGAHLTDRGCSSLLFITDGISKAFAAGGLRCGFMACPDQEWTSQIQTLVKVPPGSLLRAWDSVYSGFLDEAPHAMLDLEQTRKTLQHYLVNLRQQLTVNRAELLSLLKMHRLDDGVDTKLRGGLFVLAKLADRRHNLAVESKLLINADDWSRTLNYSRLCFSLPPERWQEAMRRLDAALKK